MEIKIRDIPLFLIAFFGTTSPYFLALYLFDKQEFLTLGIWNCILLSTAYSFPVIYLNIYIFELWERIRHNTSVFEFDDKNGLIGFVMGLCIASAHQLYGVLLYCLIFCGNNSSFTFLHYRNNTWIFTSSFLLFFILIFFIKVIISWIFPERKNIGKTKGQNPDTTNS